MKMSNNLKIKMRGKLTNFFCKNGWMEKIVLRFFYKMALFSGELI